MTERSHYISSQRALLTIREALAALLTYDAGLLPADRKINTAGSLPGQTLSRIHHDSRQQPEVVSAVPDLVHLPRGDGGPLLVLPESVQLCVEEAKTKEEAGVLGGREIKTRLVKVLRLPKKRRKKKPGCRCFPQNKGLLAVCCQDGDQSGSSCTSSSEQQRWNFSFLFFFSYQRCEFSVV